MDVFHIVINAKSDPSNADFEMDDVECETEHAGNRAGNTQPTVQLLATFTGPSYVDKKVNGGEVVQKLSKMFTHVVLSCCEMQNCFHQFSKL